MEDLSNGITLDQLDWLRRERLALAKLTNKQKVFCETYCRTFDKKLALKEAGYYLPKQKGGSQAKLIEDNFSKIMESPAVQEYILLLKQSVASRLGVSMDDIIEEYKAMAFTNMADYVEWDKNGLVNFKSSKVLSKAQKIGILEISETETKLGRTIKIKLHNKQTALDKLFEVLKVLEEKETGSSGPAQITNVQVIALLSDPVKRRALEHVSEVLFNKPIKLVGTDKNKEEFNKYLDKITAKLLEATSGIGGSGTPQGPGVPQIEAEAGKGEDRGSYRGQDQETEKTESEKQSVCKDENDRPPAGEDELVEPNRYDLDGL